MWKKRCVSLYVEWVNEENISSVIRLLERIGADLAGIDEDIDLENYPSPEIKRNHTVLRIRINRKMPSFVLLTELIHLPEVASVSEMHSGIP